MTRWLAVVAALTLQQPGTAANFLKCSNARGDQAAAVTAATQNLAPPIRILKASVL